MEVTAVNQGAGGAASDFLASLVALNRLGAIGFCRLLFAPGMLFDRLETWWPDAGLRPASHEGLDICFFETTSGQGWRLDETAQVPAAFDGEIVGKCDDFLGNTIIARHRLPAGDRPTIYGFYAHILPAPHLDTGDRVAAGQAVGRIAPIRQSKKRLPPHLHLTFARPDLLPPIDQLSWPVLNRLERHVFYDPLKVLDLPYRIIDGMAGDPSEYLACRPLADAGRSEPAGG